MTGSRATSACVQSPDVRFGSNLRSLSAQLGSPLYSQEQTSPAGPVRSEKCRYCCKSRKSSDPENLAKVDLLDFSAAASLFNATAEVRDRFWMKRYGPSRCRA